MTPLLAATLDHLRALVLFDTRNPPRAIGTGGIFAYLRDDCATTPRPPPRGSHGPEK